MKLKLLMALFLVFAYHNSICQKLTLNDLTNICSKSKWEEVNRILVSKGWEYYDSEKGDTYNYNTITWSYNRDRYNDKAQAWFYLYTYEGFPNKIIYSIFNQDSYKLLENGISSNGFKLVDSEIKDNEIISTYGNSKYTLDLSTERRKREEDYYSSSLTAYTITLILKAGIYDPNNGKKTEYYYDDKIYSEYTLKDGEKIGQQKIYYLNGNLKKIGNYSNGLENGTFKEYFEDGSLQLEYIMKNGELNGKIKTYYENGNVKKEGNYIKGKANGSFTEYNEEGLISATYNMLNDELNGVLKTYENQKINESYTFKNGLKEGEYLGYLYDEEDGELSLKIKANYSNDEYDGLFQVFVIDEKEEKLIDKITYFEGVKNGPFQESKGDSLIIGNYLNGKLNGEYKVYFDFVRMLIGGVIRTDIKGLSLLSEGFYNNDNKSGYWKYYDITGALRSEGDYSNDLKNGEWKYYYSKMSGVDDIVLPYSQALYLIENYKNGKLDGKSTRFSILERETYPCSEEEKLAQEKDTCVNIIYEKILETSFYKNGKLNGPFELRDSLNEIIAKGNFKDDLKEGEWFHRYSDQDINEKTYFIYQKGSYKNNEREGKWVQYYTEGQIAETFNYKNGELHGEYIEWNQFKKPREKKKFNYGKLSELITYDSLGVNPKNKYEIYDEKNYSYKCRRTEYYDEGYVSQEYWVKKDDEINHNFFELTFMLSTSDKISNGTTGYKDGDFKLFNAQNLPLITGKYYKEDKIGLWTFYYYEQNVKILSNFTKNKKIDEKYYNLKDELFSGKFTYYDNENDIREERKIKNGMRNGKTTYINTKTTKTIRKENYKNGILK